MNERDRKQFIFAMIVRKMIFDDDLHYKSRELFEMNKSERSTEMIVIYIILLKVLNE